MKAINVENQERNLSSLLWWMRRIIAKRKQYKAFSSGDIEFIDTNNSKILAFTRSYEEQKLLVIINLSRYSQQANLISQNMQVTFQSKFSAKTNFL